MKNFIGNLNIAMIIVWAIGFFGGMAEPGPVPKLMVVVAGAYLAFSISAEIALRAWLSNKRRMKHGRSRKLAYRRL